MAASSSSTEIRRDDMHILSEFEDTDRQHYIQKILAIDDTLEKIPRANLFYLWFADKGILRQMAYLEGNWRPCHVTALLSLRPYPPADPVWTVAKGKIDNADQREQLANVRDQNQASNALIRDRNRCVFTRHGEPGVDVALIVPFGLHNIPRVEAPFWCILDCFWGDKFKAWLEPVIGADDRFNTERATNMISLNSLLHEYWDNCQCAFRPVRVSDDQMSMNIAFHWLPLPTGRKSDKLRIDQNPYGVGAAQSDLRSLGQNLVIFDYETGREIRSGEIFTITTTDKEERPLPSKELLELLWLLKRMAAMQGEERPEVEDHEDLDTDVYSSSDYSDNEGICP